MSLRLVEIICFCRAGYERKEEKEKESAGKLFDDPPPLPRSLQVEKSKAVLRLVLVTHFILKVKVHRLSLEIH